jgi:DNA gyrase subunit A
MGIKLSDEADGLIGMDVVQADGYLWSITDNGLAKATPMEAYPTQGRYGQGVINMRLPKEAAEVVAAIVVPDQTEVLVLTSLGSTKRVPLHKTVVGSRSITPKSVFKVGLNNRVTGALTTLGRPEVENGETAVAQQLSLIDEPAQDNKIKKEGRKMKAK